MWNVVQIKALYQPISAQICLLCSFSFRFKQVCLKVFWIKPTAKFTFTCFMKQLLAQAQPLHLSQWF